MRIKTFGFIFRQGRRWRGYRPSVQAWLLVAVLLVVPAAAAAKVPGDAAKQEITHLFAYLQGSACSFQRNGDWHESQTAAAHLDRKYRYLLERGLVTSAESFIERAATGSSITGRPYLVKCGEGEPVESAAWFAAELQRYRKKGYPGR
jgi:hypothetical protein